MQILLDNATRSGGSSLLGIGSAGGDGTGSAARVGGQALKYWAADCNTMFAEIYGILIQPAPVLLTDLGGIARWFHVGNSLAYSALAAGALTTSVTLFNLPPGGVLHGVKIVHSASFGGGAISAYSLSLGISGSLAKYASAFDVFQAPSGTAFQLSSEMFSENNAASTAVLLTATSVGANLNAATSGQVDIYASISIAL